MVVNQPLHVPSPALTTSSLLLCPAPASRREPTTALFTAQSSAAILSTVPFFSPSPRPEASFMTTDGEGEDSVNGLGRQRISSKGRLQEHPARHLVPSFSANRCESPLRRPLLFSSSRFSRPALPAPSCVVVAGVDALRLPHIGHIQMNGGGGERATTAKDSIFKYDRRDGAPARALLLGREDRRYPPILWIYTTHPPPDRLDSDSSSSVGARNQYSYVPSPAIHGAHRLVVRMRRELDDDGMAPRDTHDSTHLRR
ncbi:hypothetical protein R3P38DRAFT_3227489 [Favolaschia claudopus]|uniref:Uncharacterized protein n=1 Tax=Favolaschia claudopus TaxID=2862362 RepID=A0AAV9ZTB6_9AGAR